MITHIEGQLGFVLTDKTLFVRLLCGANGAPVKASKDNSTERARMWRDKNRDLYNRRRREKRLLRREHALPVESP